MTASATTFPVTRSRFVGSRSYLESLRCDWEFNRACERHRSARIIWETIGRLEHREHESIVVMSMVEDVVRSLRELPTNSERGTAFEKLMVRYFKLDPTLSQEYDEVYRWVDWPWNGGTADTGIDLVARNREDGSWTAIQCKFYEPDTYLQKAHLDSFFTASGRRFETEQGTESFSNRIIISTTDRWSKNAEEAIREQVVPVQRIGLADIADSPLDWEIAYPAAGGRLDIRLERREIFQPRPHQALAIERVMSGFETHDRGKLIMACGTGKTFTALRLAETLADAQNGRATVLFAVPSISLLSQSLREWMANAAIDIRVSAVCSDNKVSQAAEDITTYDLEIPVTTDGAKLASDVLTRRKHGRGLNVVFTTYQSLSAIHEAQQQGAPAFDLIICDEAHRTTGITLAGEEPSAFTSIHDENYIQGSKRLYMTATPRLYDDKVKDKADEHSAEVSSMDDEAIYGPEFHRLGFGEAVEKGLLTDYKVLVLGVDDDIAAETAQQTTSLTDSEITLDTTAKIIGAWTGLAKRSGKYQGFAAGELPMQRAVAFARDIRASKNVADVAPTIIDQYTDAMRSKAMMNEVDTTNLNLSLDVRHVDGTMNALQRGNELAWLKAPVPDGKCRVLTNARCLSEGVDVPSLDAVLFLNPRNSVVDVVQSVGRVMRKSEGKDYGYIILPVAIPAGVKPSAALNDNQRFKVVWQVLNALRAHDDRFNAIVNSAVLNQKTATDADTDRLREKVEFEAITQGDAEPSDDERMDIEKQLVLFSTEQWQEAMYAKIVDKVGDREYWEDWADDVATIAEHQIARITTLLNHADGHVIAEFDTFLEGLRGNLNDSITRADAVSMLSQHLITAPVFDALFTDAGFAQHNPVSIVMQRMIDALGDQQLEDETQSLERFYNSVRVRASEVTSAAGKQTVIKDLYERFFKKAFKRQSEALGIVYTPTEIVDYILRAANDALQLHFDKSLSDEGVHILDPFTGTGTFMVRLLQSGLIRPEDLARKYATELHATEIMLLAYYVAAVNIETTYNALQAERSMREGGDAPDYVPFIGIALADTFQASEEDDQLDVDVFKQNNERIQRQLDAPIHVIIGNPPYSVGQTSANDLNANVKYPTLDSRIADTYAAKSTATNKNSLYDSYLRAYRWATDRIGDRGIVAFVSNGGWLDGNTGDGVRLSFADDFTDIYIYNLRGNARTAGEPRRKEAGNVFRDGGRTTIAITIGVKRPGIDGCTIHYRDIGDYLTADEKLHIINAATLDNTDWQTIEPNTHGDWLGQRNPVFATWPVLSDKRSSHIPRIFTTYSAGLQTNRDAWAYNFSQEKLDASITALTHTYNAAVDEIRISSDADEFLRANPDFTEGTRIKWSSSLSALLERRNKIRKSDGSIRPALYRPFTKTSVFFHRDLNHRVYRLPSMFPTPHHDNIGFVAVSPGENVRFACLATNRIPDLHLIATSQFFPRWTWEPIDALVDELDLQGVSATTKGLRGQAGEMLNGYRRVDNITDEILSIYQQALGVDITKDDIFYFVYGQLHDPGYREAYEADLKKMLPHIETPTDRRRFDLLTAAGRELMDLHINYEDVEPYPVTVDVKKTADPGDRETWRVQKLRWAKRTDPDTGKNVDDVTTMIYNSKVTIRDIPEEANHYMLGSRSALAWIIDRYQVKKDKASGIINDPNDWADEIGNPHYIVNLIAKVTRVAVETMRIVDTLSQDTE